MPSALTSPSCFRVSNERVYRFIALRRQSKRPYSDKEGNIVENVSASPADQDESVMPIVPDIFKEALRQADIRIGGKRPWDIRLNTPGALNRVLAKGSLGLGEAYMDNEWDVDALDEFFDHVLKAQLDKKLKPLAVALLALQAKIFNLQNIKRAWDVGEQHYDLGNDFFQAMLDPRMTYTCGYWKRADNLADAQEDKLELICRKLELKAGMRVLDIGCGWGSFMGYAAEKHGVECVGLTISKEQAAWGAEKYAGLPVEFRLQDYREETERFDRVVSIGMFEHVGHKNYRMFMEVARRCLAEDGLFLLHTIGNNVTQGGTDPWIHKYIFPNGELPSLSKISASAEGLFVVEDLHNFGSDYEKTLMAWHQNFERAWPTFSAQLGDRFYRMWRYYLLMCAGAFRARDIQLWQWVLSPNGVRGGYSRVS